MPDWLIIAGVPPWDGRYEIDLDQEMNNREWGWIKKYAGYASPLDMGPNATTDPEMICVYALIALHRNGKVEQRDIPDLWGRFQDAPFPSGITFEPGSERDADPPRRSSNVRPSSNGDSSSTDTATPETATGDQSSATSESAPAMSVT